MSDRITPSCKRAEALRDYAFDELPAPERTAIEGHLATCDECSLELDRLQVTTAALRALPDREIPQRIAFVSDKVFEPSAASRWFAGSWFRGFWNSAARLGFASACVLAAGLIVSAYHRPAQPPAIAVSAPPAGNAAQNRDVSQEVNAAVAKAVSQVRLEDARMTRAALEAVNRKHEQEHREMMVAMQENFEFLQKHLNTNTLLALSEAPASGAGQ